MKPYLTNWSISTMTRDFNQSALIVRVDFELSDGTKHFTWMNFSTQILSIQADIMYACKEVLLAIKNYISNLK